MGEHRRFGDQKWDWKGYPVISFEKLRFDLVDGEQGAEKVGKASSKPRLLSPDLQLIGFYSHTYP